MNFLHFMISAVFGIAGLYNTYRAFKRLRSENKYIRRLLKENKELKEKIITLENGRDSQGVA